MHYSIALAALAFVGNVPSVAAHGKVEGIIHNNQYTQGWYPWVSTPTFQWAVDPAQWFDPVLPHMYQTDDVICHLNSSVAPIHLTAAAGDIVEYEWSGWLESHQGPVLDYMANCNGPCETVNKEDLKFFKIGEEGLLSGDGSGPEGNRGTWAADQLRENNSSWIMRIPPTLAPGNYVARHEIIALHMAYEADGAQHYISCINIEVTGSGTENPEGVPGTQLYQSEGPGLNITIWTTHTAYDIPGPTLWSGAMPPIQTGAFQMPNNSAIPLPPGYNGAAVAATLTVPLPVAFSTGAVSTGSAPTGTGAATDTSVGMSLTPIITGTPSTNVGAVSANATPAPSQTKKRCSKVQPTTTTMANNKRRHAREVMLW